MSDLIQREIKGITGKLVVSFIVAYTTILLSVLGIYFSTMSNFDRLSEQIRLQNIENQKMSTFIERETAKSNVKIETMQNQLFLQKIDIEKIKQHLNIK